MATEPKTRPTTARVADYIGAVEHPRRRRDAEAVCAAMQAASGAAPVMWGASIVGFGTYPSPSGDWPRIAFSPRKAHLVLYTALHDGDREALLPRLGPMKTRGGCIYVTDLARAEPGALEALCAASWRCMAERYRAGLL